MKKKILTILLVLTMGLSLVGCDKRVEDSATTSVIEPAESEKEEEVEEFVSSGLYDNYDIKGTLLYRNGSWVFVARERDTREEKTFLYHMADKKLVEFTLPELPLCDVSGYSIVYFDPDVTEEMYCFHTESTRYEVMNVETGEVYLDEVGLLNDYSDNFYAGNRLGVYTSVDVEGTKTFGVIDNAGEWIYEMNSDYPFLADDCEWDGFSHTYLDEHGEYVYWNTRGSGNTFYNLEDGSIFNMNEKAGENVNYCWRTGDDFYMFHCNNSGTGGYYLKYNCVQDVCDPVTDYYEYITSTQDESCKILIPENFRENVNYEAWFTDVDEHRMYNMEFMKDEASSLLSIKGGAATDIIVESNNSDRQQLCYYHVSDGGAEGTEITDVTDLFYRKDAYYCDNMVIITDEETGWMVYDLSTKELTEYPEFTAKVLIVDRENRMLIASSDGAQYMIYVDDIENWFVPL